MSVADEITQAVALDMVRRMDPCADLPPENPIARTLAIGSVAAEFHRVLSEGGAAVVEGESALDLVRMAAEFHDGLRA